MIEPTKKLKLVLIMILIFIAGFIVGYSVAEDKGERVEPIKMTIDQELVPRSVALY